MASILIIGPHPDDQELGMGGTIALLASQGHKVHLLDATNGEPTPLGTPEKRALESEAAAKILNLGECVRLSTSVLQCQNGPFINSPGSWIEMPHAYFFS